MPRHARYSPEVRERAVRMMAEHRDEYPSEWAAEDLEAVALTINNRPRKILDWKTPAEVFNERLRSLQQPGVATTD
jgi:IS30 family transposase